MRYKESDIQKRIVRAVRTYFPHSLIFSVPNEGKRNVRLAGIMKANGMLHGTADLILLHKGQCLFLEVKAPSGKQTLRQKEFQQNVAKQGFFYKVVYSADEVLEIIDNITA